MVTNKQKPKVDTQKIITKEPKHITKVIKPQRKKARGEEMNRGTTKQPENNRNGNNISINNYFKYK